MRKSVSVSRQFAALAVLTAVILALMLGVTFYRARAAVQHQRKVYLENMTAQLKISVQQNYATYVKMMRLVSYDRDIQSFLLAEDTASRVERYPELKENLSAFSSLNDQILDIVIRDGGGSTYCVGDMFSYPPPDAPTLLASGLSIGPLQELRRGSSGRAYLTLMQDIYSIDNYLQTSQKIGTLCFVLTPDAFVSGSPFAGLESGSSLYLTDMEDRVLWSNCSSADQEAFDKMQATAADSGSFLVQMELAELPFRITACQEDISVLYAGGIDFFFVICFCVLIVFLGLFWVLWTRKLVRPLRELTAFTEEVCGSDLSALSKRVALTGYQEATVLSTNVNHMLRRIAALTEELIQKNEELYRSRLLVRQSELMHLRSQINPHFLYNTLETMVGIAYTEGLPQIAEIARALSLIFKYTVKGSSIVPLRDELKIVKNYLLIQGVRFADRFHTEYDLDEDCLSLPVPKMILQPLIENAIVHGIEGQQNHCTLVLAAHKGNGKLVLTVSDNGSGIPDGELMRIRENLSREHPAEDSSHHIGMQNVHERIRLMYGSEYGLGIESRLGEGTTIRLTLPTDQTGGNEHHVSSHDRR